NEGAASIFGYTSDEVLGRPLETLIPERFRATHAEHVKAFGRSDVVARRMGERGRISGLRKNGEEFPAEAAISHFGETGSKIFTVVLRDITERKRAHETQQFLAEAGEVLASSLGLEDTLANVTRPAVPRLADACIVNVYRGGTFQRATVGHIDPVYGEELEQRRREHPIDPEGTHPIAAAIRSLKALILSVPATHELFDPAHPSLTDIFHAPPSDAIILPLTARDQILGVLELYRRQGTYNSNDLFLAEELGRRAAVAMDNARLHELVHAGVRARDDMIGIVSHDLRNPVNAVKMLTGVMLDTERSEPFPPGTTEYARVIRQAAEQMDSLISDLLDVTRVEAGRLKVDARRANTEELLSDALRTLAPVAAEKSLTLRLTAPDDIPDVMADGERVRQAFSNLVGNAIKFSPPGTEILVRVALLDGEVLFSVSDRGVGMTPEQLSHAFDRFWQSSRTDRQGAGLGLAITKGIVDAHHGRIWAESKPDAGSTFYFTLPKAG
ncbi:MAG TPA: ATP-binding protein, partial [Gemmatimonadaceae bacterium]|nr:ATP-binding protein [Gemmatimonadaceae bacterium]